MKLRSAAGSCSLVHDIFRNLKKDCVVEFRSRVSFAISMAFAGISTIAVSLVSGGVPFSSLVQAILLWLILFFSAMNGLAHIFTREEEEGTSLFLLLNSNLDAVFLGKLIFNIVFFFVLQVLITPLYLFFIQAVPARPGHFIAAVISGGVAISSSTTFLGAMVAKAGGRGSLFTIISFPVLLPVLWISIAETAGSLQSGGSTAVGNLVFLLAFSGLVVAISLILFRAVWNSQ